MMKLFLALALLVSSLSQADDFLPVDEAFQINIERIGSQFVVSFDIADNYYLYRDRYEVNNFDGAAVSGLQFSENVIVKYDPNFDEDMAVFYNTMSITHSVAGAESGYVQLVYQGCADAGLCYPPQKRLFNLDGSLKPVDTSAPLSLDLSDELSGLDPIGVEQSAASLTILGAMLFAVLGGLVLNLMPCVFPVLSLKAMHMAHLGGEAKDAKLQGIAYAIGVVVSFIVVAAVLLIVRYFGEWVGWGFQLQSPVFVSFLVLLFFFMSLTMTGYIEVGQNLMGVGQGLTQKSGLTGSFFTGVLATVVATPCTAPFMGSAIGFALIQPPFVSLLIFSAMGLGLALPILAISFIPSLGRLLPKPGAWMTVFRQLMAFPLFATALWLVWVLVELRGTDALLKVGLGLILLSVAIWPALNVKSGQSTALMMFKRASRVSLLVLALFMVLDQRVEQEIWQDYSPQLVSQSLAEGKSVFIDVTAAWCITCKANERIALSGDRFEKLVNDNGIVLVKADWTNPSPQVDALIADFNRDGVPLYAFYEAGSFVPEILPQILTYGLIEETFSRGG